MIRSISFSRLLSSGIRVKLEDPDSDDEEDNCTLVIGVIQKHRRKIKKLGAQNLTIGFSIYKVTFCRDLKMNSFCTSLKDTRKLFLINQYPSPFLNGTFAKLEFCHVCWPYFQSLLILNVGISSILVWSNEAKMKRERHPVGSSIP